MPTPLRPCGTALTILCCLAGSVRAQPKALQPPPDHGMVLAACMEVVPGKLKDTTKRSDTKNYVYRGRIISLNKERTVSLCFDTDTMRVAGAWIGKPVAYTADKNMGPTVEGKMLFSTRPGPGCTKDKKWQWNDPRDGGQGPLPSDWAHYRGLYLSRDKVVLSYTIGDCEVLEMPTALVSEHSVAVIRTFKFGPSSRDQWLTMFDRELRASTKTSMKSHSLYPGDRNSPRVIDIDRGDNRLVLITAGHPRGVGVNFAPERVAIRIAPHKDNLAVVAVIAQVAPGKAVADVLGPVFRERLHVDGFTKGGPPRRKVIIQATGTVTPSGKSPYVVDDIALPTANPWHMPVRPSGFDFFPDGRAAVCTWDGDVWIVSGLDNKLDKVRWKRFAAGLQQPLGLKIVDGYIYTAGRDQITKLHDLNGDGEADFYENFNNDAPLTLQRHEFVMDLQTDAAGNFYFGRSGHYVAARGGANCCIYKLSPDGKKLTVFAAASANRTGSASALTAR